MSATVDANVDVTIGTKIDARTDWPGDADRAAVPRGVEQRISRGFAVVPQLDSLGIIYKVKNSHRRRNT